MSLLKILHIPNKLWNMSNNETPTIKIVMKLFSLQKKDETSLWWAFNWRAISRAEQTALLSHI